MWNSVSHYKTITADLEVSFLHLKTGSAVGSGEGLTIQYYDDLNNYAGGIGILFTHPLQLVGLMSCQQPRTHFITSLPENIWMIKKRGYRTVIYCNGIMVIDITASSATCDDLQNWEQNDTYGASWPTIWGRKVSRIQLWPQTNNHKSKDYYYIGKTGY